MLALDSAEDGGNADDEEEADIGEHERSCLAEFASTFLASKAEMLEQYFSLVIDHVRVSLIYV